jgi:hypothetical protein
MASIGFDDSVAPVEPLTGPDAFAASDDAASLAQAAILLLSSRMLRGDRRLASASERWAVREPLESDYDANDLARFPLPALQPDAGRVPAARTERERVGITKSIERMTRYDSDQSRIRVAHALAVRLYDQPTVTTAAALMSACLEHPNDLVGVAAAASYFWHGTEPRRCLEILRAGVDSQSDLVRDLAATALSRIAPGDPTLGRLSRPGPRVGGGNANHTATIVHGTWARRNRWWQPGGDFHAYLASEVRPDMYSATDRFEWSGRYRPDDRAMAGLKLADWVGTRGLGGLDLFGHSHGGSVLMLATHNGMRAGKLVLLSCPAHENVYLPDFTRIGACTAVRVHLDLVVIADGGGLRFHDPRIRDVPLGVWFNHSASHDPQVWRDGNVAARI